MYSEKFYILKLNEMNTGWMVATPKFPPVCDWVVLADDGEG